MSGKEKAAILQDQRITPSRSKEEETYNWGLHYKPNTVIFLFELDSANCLILNKIPQIHHENYDDETWILEFDGDLLTEKDSSQNTWPGAVVVYGVIELNNIFNVVWTQYKPIES